MANPEDYLTVGETLISLLIFPGLLFAAPFFYIVGKAVILEIQEKFEKVKKKDLTNK